MPRTFRSEEERQAALDALPEAPPMGVDVDAWQMEQSEERNEIMSAEIVPEGEPPAPAPAPEGAEPPAPEPTPAPSPEPGDKTPEPAPAPAPEDPVFFTLADGTKVARSELPEELRGYDNPQEVLKQYAHARKYANAAEGRLTEMATALENAQKTQEELKAKLEEVQKAQQAPAPTPTPGYSGVPTPMPVSPVEMAPEQAEMLQQLEADIEAIEADPLADEGQQAKLKDTLKKMSSSLSAIYRENSGLKTALQTAQEDFKQRLETVASSTKEQSQVLEDIKKDAESKKTAATVATEVTGIQSSYPELATSKPVFAPEGPSVESGALAFANKILMLRRGSGAKDWSEVNSIVNAFNREDPELVAFCTNNGVAPDDVGLTVSDLRNYATIVNALNMVQGKRYNEYTGQLEQMTNAWGKAVNFPSMGVAYEYLLSQGGVTKRQQEEALAQAELRGEQKLESAMQRAANSDKGIGADGAASPDSAGDELTAEQAEAVLNNIDEAEMEKRALNGDRSMWNAYTKAYKVVSGVELPPPSHWPAPPQQMGVPAT